MTKIIGSIIVCLFLNFCAIPGAKAQHLKYTTNEKTDSCFILAESNLVASILMDEKEHPGVIKVGHWLQNDLETITSVRPDFSVGSIPSGKSVIIIGTLGMSKLIEDIIIRNNINVDEITGRWETSMTLVLDNPIDGIDKALVIIGSDKRGTIYGTLDLSRSIGVSPWYWWADVTPNQQSDIYIPNIRNISKEPKVRYRGIFLNDEAPALSGWAYATFGGFNHNFYEKVFELILRLKGNFLWPAMWGNAFFDDDAENGPLADEYGIVIGSSHHEPMGRAHDEWRRYGTGDWDYSQNPKELENYWKNGINRSKTWETLTTIGMRGDGDEPMTEESNIALLESIVSKQREIIQNETGKPASQVPQVWALYKEVQDYYDKGMRVPDDVTLLLCDDNWGNIRKLPDLKAPKREGGYGIYYHFDYVGDPRNYKWLNVSHIPRVWEQMNLAWEYGVDRIWVVNVGDLKPMEYPITFFLDMAWDPDRFNQDMLLTHTEEFCEEQFGKQFAKESARLINLYTKYNRRITPELLNSNTYSLHNYNEFELVTRDYKKLSFDALRLYYQIPLKLKDAFDQLVLFPIQAMANLYELYYAVAMNHDLAEQGKSEANQWADLAHQCFDRDSLLSIHYHDIMSNGKWKHFMDQTHIGYTYWQQPQSNTMPVIYKIPEQLPNNEPQVFMENNGVVSMEAEHFTRCINNLDVHWIVLPYLGKTLSGVTTSPPTHDSQLETEDPAYLEYDFYIAQGGSATISLLLSPTLSFNQNRGLQYSISLNDGRERIVNINGDFSRDKHMQWLSNQIIKSSTNYTSLNKGKQTLRIRAIDPGIVLQKIVVDLGGLKSSYLGPPESNRLSVSEIPENSK